jgi:hypothetical protein
MAGDAGPPDAELIRQVRAASNAALAARDLVGLGGCLAPDYLVITSTNVRTTGRVSTVERLALEFLAKPDMELVRDPSRIRVFEAWGTAHETGRWRRSWTTPEGVVTVSGIYSAKWQKYQDAGWLIEAELFVPTDCGGGSDCRRPLPEARSRRPPAPPIAGPPDPPEFSG